MTSLISTCHQVSCLYYIQEILNPYHALTLPMLRLPSSKAQGRNDFRKPSKPCQVGIHLKALTEYSQVSTHMPGFQSFFFRFLASFRIGQIGHHQHKGSLPTITHSPQGQTNEEKTFSGKVIDCKWKPNKNQNIYDNTNNMIQIPYSLSLVLDSK